MRGQRQAIAVAMGGAIGTALRIGVGELTATTGRWPWPTLVVNVTGALLLGWVTGWLRHERVEDRTLAILVTSGLLGSYTTFSTFAAELRALGTEPLGVVYATLSVVLGVGAALAGRQLAGTGSRP